MYYRSITELVGGTPLFEPVRFNREQNPDAKLLLKLEYLNPAGSAKDRVALSMILDAEVKGLLKPGSAIIEPTSGNTGIGLAAIGVPRGYRVILTMPDTMSMERRLLLSAYGAEIVLTPGAEGMTGAIAKAKELAAEIPDSFIPSQFDNPANPAAHAATTGPELYEDTNGHIDILVAGVGTGGTLSGTARYLRRHIPSLQVVAVEPAASPLLSLGKSGAHGLQGIGANFVPDNLDRALIDEVFAVTEADAYKAARALARAEGLLVGISSGAALFAASELAKRPGNRGKVIAVVLPDTGDRYLSTPLFQE
ncbi:MAG: cysteine synthase A [Clostridia bacterium]|nr:cysteine synthase A [Clostridia bacterium]